ncbi:MAG: hypothetical protein ACKOL0_01240, partial [Solirubrobacterales bacterium]
MIKRAFLNLTHCPAAWLRPPEAASSQGTVLDASAEGARERNKARLRAPRTSSKGLRARETAEWGDVRGCAVIVFSYRLPAGLAVGLALHLAVLGEKRLRP